MKFDFNSWDRRNRFNGTRFSMLLGSNRITALHKYITNSLEWNRRKYNQMNGEQQREWEDKFYKPKTEYGFSIDNQDSWYIIPRAVFEMIVGKFPGLIVKERSFYSERRD